LPLDELIPGSVGLLLGLVGVGWFGHLVVRARLARRWNVVEGVVTSVRSIEVSRGKGDQSPGGRRTLVTYEYVVAGQTRRGDRLWFGEEMDQSVATAEAVARRYREGQRVTVLVHPSDASRAVLEPRASWLAWAGLFGSGGLVVVMVRELFLLG
jgi:hypothetical protein